VPRQHYASTRVKGAPGSSQHAKCSVGPAGEQVELSASPRRPAASPTQLNALADGALRSRHETSGAPALLSAVPPPNKLHHARGSSGGPALGQAARSRQRRRRCATSSRCLRACRARRSSAAWRRAQLRCAHLNGEHLSVGGGVVGWVTARKIFVGRLPKIWGSIYTR
jgi:hypothetical protein